MAEEKIFLAANQQVISIILRVFRRKYDGKLIEKFREVKLGKRWIDKIGWGIHGSSDEKLLTTSMVLYEMDPKLFEDVINVIHERRKKHTARN